MRSNSCKKGYIPKTRPGTWTTETAFLTTLAPDSSATCDNIHKSICVPELARGDVIANMFRAMD